MNRHIIKSFVLAACLIAGESFAGNPDRAGSAGASQLKVNPWARSNGLANSNSASVRGAEAIFHNVAGLAFTTGTEVMYNYSDYLRGADIDINAIGFSQKVGVSGVLGFNVTLMSFGDIERTTTANPDGGLGSYSPSFSNIGVSYAKAFSNSIYGGVTVRIFSESISEVRGTGVAFDAGIRYVTGPKENIRFGIALKNVGPSYSYSGDGLAQQFVLTDRQYDIQLTGEQRVDDFELPSQLNIGLSYDLNIDEKNIVTLHGTFTSNSFGKDLIQGGVEYGFTKRFFVRGGYMFERKAPNEDENNRTNIMTGIAAGFGVKLPIGSTNRFNLDYSYRVTNPFDGIHTLGVKVDIN